MKLNFWKKIKHVVGIAFVSCLFSATAFAQLVTVDGLGHDRESALKDARRMATESVLGTYLTNQSLVRENVIVSDDIYTKTAGFVGLQRIISEGKTAGGYRITATFDVNTSPNSDFINQLELLILLKDPRIAVIVFDKNGFGMSEHEEVSEAAMNERLIQMGFNHVVDANAVTMLQDSAFLEAIYNGTSGRIGNTGIKGVDYFVVAKTNATCAPINIYGKTSSMLSARASLAAKLIKADTGDLLGNFVVDGTGVDINEMMATQKALMAAGQAAGEKLAQSFTRKAQNIASGVQVEVEGSAEEVQAVARDLRMADGVKNVIVREATMSRGLIEVETDLSPDALYRALKAVSRLGLIMDGVSGGVLKIVVI